MKKSDKLIDDNDIYFLLANNQNIIVNNNYEGILVLDYNFNIKKKITTFSNMCIYSSYIIGDEGVLLYCPENERIIYLNIITNQKTILQIPKIFVNQILHKMIFYDDSKCIFITYDKKHIEIDLNKKTIIEIFNFDKHAIVEDFCNEEVNRLIEGNNDYINIENCDDHSCVIYEDKIYYVHGIEREEILPENNFMFLDASLIKKNNVISIIALASAKYDCKKNKIIIYEK